MCRWVSSMVIAFLSTARQGGGASQCWAVGADVVGTAVDRYLAAGGPRSDGLVAVASRLATGSSTGWPWRCARLATCLCARWSAPPYCRVEVVRRNVHLQHEGYEGLDLGPLDIHAPARTAARLHQVKCVPQLDGFRVRNRHMRRHLREPLARRNHDPHIDHLHTSAGSVLVHPCSAALGSLTSVTP